MDNGEFTKWEGLWFNRQGVYSGRVIKKKDIPTYARLIVRFNKYYEADSGRPKFVYCFASGDAAFAITMEREQSEDQEERLFTRDEVQTIINRVASRIGGDAEYGMHLVEDFI